MRVALTFDDGPSVWTPGLLDVLAEFGAHATFFVLGVRFPYHAQVARRALKEGHEIGVHGWKHERMSTMSAAECFRDLDDCARAFCYATGVEPAGLWRAPHLDVTQDAVRATEMLNLEHVGADIDPADWVAPDPRVIADRVFTSVFDGAIVLLHDGIPPDGGTGTQTRQPTVDAVRLILEGLPDTEFVTVSELARVAA